MKIYSAIISAPSLSINQATSVNIKRYIDTVKNGLAQMSKIKGDRTTEIRITK